MFRMLLWEARIATACNGAQEEAHTNRRPREMPLNRRRCRTQSAQMQNAIRHRFIWKNIISIKVFCFILDSSACRQTRRVLILRPATAGSFSIASNSSRPRWICSMPDAFKWCALRQWGHIVFHSAGDRRCFCMTHRTHKSLSMHQINWFNKQVNRETRLNCISGCMRQFQCECGDKSRQRVWTNSQLFRVKLFVN